MPLTSGSVTIKLAGGTYSTWAAFWDDLGNLTGNITCTVDASAFTEGTAPAPVTETLGGFTLHVLPASFPTSTDASTGARFTGNYTGIFLDMQMEGPGTLIIEGMVFIEGTSEPTYALRAILIDTEFDLIYRRNIVKGTTLGVSIADVTLTGYSLYNNIIYDASNTGMYLTQDASSAIVANNTIVNCDEGFSANSKILTAENNLSYGSGNLDYTGIATNTIGNNNANSDHTGDDGDWGGGGANNVYLDVMSSNPFNDLGADDFTISEAGDALIGTAGKDLSGSFTDDFFGVTRVKWTIGACEFITPPTTVEATGEGEVEVGVSIKHAVETTGEGEAAVGVSIQLGIEATGEGEVSITTLLNFIQAVEATGEGEAEIGIALQTLLEATGEGEVSISTLIIIAIVELTANMNFSGSISAQNPNWLLLDDSLAWREEWDETVTYDPFDAVLYKTADGGEWHVFVSKVSHNIGNIPTTSPAYWRRYYQEQFV